MANRKLLTHRRYLSYESRRKIRKMGFRFNGVSAIADRVSKKGARRDDAQRFAELVQRIATNAAELRKDRGWTQQEAAVECSLDIRVYGRVERGEGPPSLMTIARLCSGFRVDAVRLIRPLRGDGSGSR
jgi:DNA-binding XRE family transcriptional regulator